MGIVVHDSVLPEGPPGVTRRAFASAVSGVPVGLGLLHGKIAEATYALWRRIRLKNTRRFMTRSRQRMTCRFQAICASSTA
jgi:hypothetical protein